MPQDTILIKINQKYHDGISPQELYDMTRGVWRLDKHRTNNIKYAFSVYKSEVKEVYEIDSWHDALTTKYYYRDDLDENDVRIKERFEFIGKPADETLRKCFIGKYLLKYSKKGASNPVRYVSLELLMNDFCLDQLVYPDEISDSNSLFEGAKKQIIVNAYERNPEARKQCIEYYGLNCMICDFNFEEVYGKIGKNFIHVHHLKPLSEVNEQYEVNPIKDLIPICPNCHAMLHKKIPAYSIEALKNMLCKS